MSSGWEVFKAASPEDLSAHLSAHLLLVHLIYNSVSSNGSGETGDA